MLTGPVDETVQDPAVLSAWRAQLAADNTRTAVSTITPWPPEEWGAEQRAATARKGPEAEPEPSQLRSKPTQILVSGLEEKMSREVQEDELWGPVADAWDENCRHYDEDTTHAPIAKQWAEECRAWDNVHRYRGGDDLATALASTLSSKVQATRERRKREKKVRNANKHRTVSLFRAATQNFNGGSGQEKLEELVRNMVKRNLGIVFGQEGRRRDDKIERWDTGEIFISAGSPNNSRKKDGNFFVLSGYWAKAFIRGGKRMKVYNPRLMTLSLPLPGRKWNGCTLLTFTSLTVGKQSQFATHVGLPLKNA